MPSPVLHGSCPGWGPTTATCHMPLTAALDHQASWSGNLYQGPSMRRHMSARDSVVGTYVGPADRLAHHDLRGGFLGAPGEHRATWAPGYVVSLGLAGRPAGYDPELRRQTVGCISAHQHCTS